MAQAERVADLVHDEEYETVVFPLTEPVDVTRSIAVDYDDRDFVPTAPAKGSRNLTVGTYRGVNRTYSYAIPATALGPGNAIADRRRSRP